jgi:hypothetical protein
MSGTPNASMDWGSPVEKAGMTPAPAAPRAAAAHGGGGGGRDALVALAAQRRVPSLLNAPSRDSREGLVASELAAAIARPARSSSDRAQAALLAAEAEPYTSSLIILVHMGALV